MNFIISVKVSREDEVLLRTLKMFAINIIILLLLYVVSCTYLVILIVNYCKCIYFIISCSHLILFILIISLSCTAITSACGGGLVVSKTSNDVCYL